MIDNNQIFKKKEAIDMYEYYVDLIKNQEFDENNEVKRCQTLI